MKNSIHSHIYDHLIIIKHVCQRALIRGYANYLFPSAAAGMALSIDGDGHSTVLRTGILQIMYVQTDDVRL